MKESDPVPDSTRARIARFVRTYFGWLDAQGIRAALLHGGGDGFEGQLSDVDHVLDPVAFRSVAGLVDRFCGEAGWRLCQVLRHEDSAAFCVCSAADDPACVVALDACGDYQRNGRVLLRAEDLLDRRCRASWGGHGLSPDAELRYRLIKAAAKAKPPGAILPDLLSVPDDLRHELAEWLRRDWGVHVREWDEPSLAGAFGELGHRCGPSTGRWRLRSVGRHLRRIARPDGLLVTGARNPGALESVFSGLYFRRHRRVERPGPAERVALIRSTLVLADSVPPGFKAGLDPGCVLNLGEGDPAERLAAHLNARCRRREGLSN